MARGKNKGNKLAVLEDSGEQSSALVKASAAGISKDCFLIPPSLSSRAPEDVTIPVSLGTDSLKVR
jgi:predicted PhzF superfamily epimerase YddE/YHI9